MVVLFLRRIGDKRIVKRYNKEKPLISIHIPKCGGRSLETVLEKWFGDNICKHYFNEKKNTMPTRYEIKPGLCIHGHFNRTKGFGVADYYPEVDQFITIVRDPFEMALSFYFYIKRREKRKWIEALWLRKYSRVDSQPSSIYRYYRKYWFSLLNHMPYDWIRILLREKGQFRDIDEFFREYSSHLLNYMPYEMTIENFKEFFERDFIHVGIAEDLQTSVDVIASKLGFQTVQVNHLNTSERDEVVSSDIKEQFITKHQLEYAVYNYVLENYWQY